MEMVALTFNNLVLPCAINQPTQAGRVKVLLARQSQGTRIWFNAKGSRNEVLLNVPIFLILPLMPERNEEITNSIVASAHLSILFSLHMNSNIVKRVVFYK